MFFVPLQCLVKTLLEFNHYQKSDKAPFIIYTDLRCLIGKINGCKNAPVKLSSKKVYEHSTSDFSVSTISPFKSKESKNNVYKGKDWMKTFYVSLRKHVMGITNFKKKKMKLLTNEQQKSDENLKICYTCKEKFKDKHAKDKTYQNVLNHCYYTG